MTTLTEHARAVAARTQAAYAARVREQGLTALLAPYTLTGPVRLPARSVVPARLRARRVPRQRG